MGILYGGRNASYYDGFGYDVQARFASESIERTFLANGRFLHNLDGWTTSGATYSAGDGDDHYGIAVLTEGTSISQQFAVQAMRSYTFHLSAKADGASATPGEVQAIITDGNGNTVLTQNLDAQSSWTEQSYTIGLVEGTSYTLTIINQSYNGTIKIDDLWLWWLPMTRAQVATRVHAKLGALATSNSLSPTPTGSLTEGSYTYAIDAGLRQIGAINPITDLPDIRQLETRQIDDLLRAVDTEMMDVLERGQATVVDITVGQRSEKLSQIAQSITRMRSRE